jgi:ketosteroid isomerase-like protein
MEYAMRKFLRLSFALALFACTCLPVFAASANDQAAVAALDTEYQAAVKDNDAATMGRILADDFVLVTGKGKTFTKADLLQSARDKTDTYEHQEDTQQSVRVWGDTAVVTALLWIKGKNNDGAYDYKLWFSDTYVRTAKSWRYVFGQASKRLTPEELAQK